MSLIDIPVVPIHVLTYADEEFGIVADVAGLYLAESDEELLDGMVRAALVYRGA